MLFSHETDHIFIEITTLRSLAGLGVHITEIYVYGCSFLKGFFNATEAWRGSRDLEGWRITEAMATVADLEQAGASHADYSVGYPLTTHITNELIEHVKALLK